MKKAVTWTLVGGVCLAAGLGRTQNLAPNPSFEDGASAPTSWSLSGGTGRWESFGRTNARCVSVTGAGSTANQWQSTQCPVVAGRPYAVRFWGLATNASGGTPISGFDVVNRDVALGNEWRAHGFIAAIPNNATQPTLRFGQWMVNGTVLFDDVEVLPVVPVHTLCGDQELGAGERLRNGHYTFQPSFSAFNGNYSRCLFQHTSSFNSDRWPLGNGTFVVYRHGFPAHAFTNAHVWVNVSYYTSGECILEASADGQLWREIGRVQPTTNGWVSAPVEGPVPAALLPAPALLVRFRATGSLQVNSYRFEGDLDGTMPDADGQTAFFELERQSPDLVVQPAAWMDTPTGKVVTVSLFNPGLLSRQVAVRWWVEGPSGTQASAQDLVMPAQGSNGVVLLLPGAGPGENVARIEMADAAQPLTLFQASVRFVVSLLQDNSFGQRLPGSTNVAVWWCDGTYKVGRERLAPTATADAVEIEAARNEFEPFQLVLRPEASLVFWRVTMSDWRTPGGAVIASTNTEVCRVEFVPVTQPTDSSTVTGYYPDPLVPLSGPFTAAAGTNTPLWFTVYVPKDAPAGRYEATVTLQALGGASITVPLRLRVFDFTLPDTTHTETAYGVSLDNRWHALSTEEDRRTVWDLYMQNCRRHRISPYSPHARAPIQWQLNNGQVTLNFTNFDAAMTRYLDEFKFNGFNLAIVPSSLDGHARFTPEYRQLYAQLMQPILAHLREKGWLFKAYCYWLDEPAVEDYPFVIEGMSALQECAPGLRRLLTEQPEPPLYSYVDLWVPIFNAYRADRCQERQAASQEVWWYVCTGPRAPYPNNFIDHPAINHRIRVWMAEKFGVTGELYWSATYYLTTNSQPRNPWEEAMSISPDGSPWGNGDGMLLYPPAKTPPSTPLLAGPINSLRWELLREALEDGEYFWLLKDTLPRAVARQGPDSPAVRQGEAALQTALALVSSQTQFKKDPRQLYSARRSLAEAIEVLDDGLPLLFNLPSPQAVELGGTATFRVEAAGWPPPQFQWFKDGVLLTGATQSTLVLSNVMQAQAGAYSVVVSNTAGASASAPASLLVLLPPSQITLVSTGAQWRYFDKGQDLGAAWRGSAYNDSTWSNGWAQLGYGDNDERTRVSYGPDGNNKYPTTYFRHTFPVAAETQPHSLVARLLRDDGAAVYLNATEVFRSNMPTGEVTYATWAPNAVSGSDESTFFPSALSAQLLQTGNNVVAVEVHQQTNTSSDLSFDFELSGLWAVQPPQILLQPAGLICREGGSAVFAVTAVSATPMSYAWLFNGAPLAFATNPAFALPNVSPEQAGLYQVVASNAAGVVTSAVANLVVVLPPTNILISAGAPWRYHDQGINLGTAWRAPAYDDSHWSNGVAKLGYGGDGETTTLSYGPDPNNKYTACYFRCACVVHQPASVTNLEARLVRDDGAVIYLNGAEVWRENMPVGAISYTTLAVNTVAGSDETQWISRTLDPVLLVEGTNILAAEVHQVASNSTDLGFNFELVALRRPNLPPIPPALHAALSDAAHFALSFASQSGQSYTLLRSTNLSDWLAETNWLGTGGVLSYTEEAAPLWPACFYQVRTP
jgi:hypothetical protein